MTQSLLPKPTANDICMIAAMAKNRVIGKNQKLPWHIAEDMQFFREMTKDSVVVMGRKTFESIGRPLPKRVNIVVSRTMQQSVAHDIKDPNLLVSQSLNDAIILAKLENKPVFIIGGASLYAEGLSLANKLYLTQVKEEYEGDTYFPEIPNAWKITQTQAGEQVEFQLLERK